MGAPVTRPRPSLTLLESAHTPSVGVRAMWSASVVGQVAVVCAVVAGTAHRVLQIEADTERPSFLAPLYQPQPRPVQQTVTFTAIGGAAQSAPEPAPGAAPAPPSDRAVTLKTEVGSGDNKPPSEAHDDDAMRAYSEIEVDSAATRDPESAGPIYPPTLMAKGIEGSVLATFVVDETGRPDLSTYIPLESTDTLFSNAVRDALPRMKFRPAKRRNVVVRQQVEQRFTFRVIKPATVVKPTG